MITDLIANQIQKVRNSIPNSVRLIAVTKTVSSEVIREAYNLGIRDFGENRLQEAITKQAELQDLKDICWHFIGHLQTNKAKKVIECFPWIHSVDSLKIAQRLNHFAEEALTQGIINTLPQVCLQVKILNDPDKYGWEIEHLWQDLPLIDQLESIQVRGLMSILPLGLSSEQTLLAFQKVNQLAQEIKAKNWSNLQMDQLSMGMSGDYHQAIKAGTTMIRLGTILFGVRQLNK
jgi:pyridoxal phosphate enzyme (YggS family)